MKKSITVIICFLTFISCRSQDNNDKFSILNKNIGQLLFNNRAITQEEFNTGKGFLIYGIHNQKIDYNNLKKGIYGVSTGSHRPIYFFVYDSDKINFLDIYSFDEFLKSLKALLEYSFEEDYCREITMDYLSRFIRLHYGVNRNLRTRINKNCEFPERAIKSIYNINTLKLNLINKLEENNEIKEEDSFLDDPDILLIQKSDMYFGIPKPNQLLEIGMYNYTNTISKDVKEQHILIDQEGVDFLKINSQVEFIETIEKIVSFGEEYNICSERTIWFIEKISKEFFNENESCFSKNIVDLP